MAAPTLLELLAPARDADIGIEAINHGADAVYIGGPGFGARDKAPNRIEDIARLVKHAHRFNARIFVTMNTILRDDELEGARQQAWQLHDAGVDALIVQDMGLLELDLPPMQLHASTQTDIRSPEKARFLQDVGFSQMVLARELDLKQIIDAQGRVVAHDKHVLSLKDNDQSDNLEALIDAGIRSFKIEGRYKDMATVKNVTAHYRTLLDAIMEKRPELASTGHGRCTFTFTPEPEQAFNRGGTDYFVNGRKIDIGAFDSPKHAGLPLGDIVRVGPEDFDIDTGDAVKVVNNGDALTWWDRQGELQGVPVNVATPLGGTRWRIEPNLSKGQSFGDLKDLFPGTAVNRNRDMAWERLLAKPSADRRIAVHLTLAQVNDGFELTLKDETGVKASVKRPHVHEPARDAKQAQAQLQEGLAKLGDTIFEARRVRLAMRGEALFLPASKLNALRRDGIAALEAARDAAFERLPRAAPVEPPVPYPDDTLTYLANVFNGKAAAFYARHGVKVIGAAYESHEELGEVPLMITKHCVRWSLSLCPKQAKGVTGVQGTVRAEPLTLTHGEDRLTLRFDCKPCEMHVVGAMRRNVLKALKAEPMTFYRSRPAA
jgi:23S rRNA 5-hydroxycytidine C2501 synthase